MKRLTRTLTLAAFGTVALTTVAAQAADLPNYQAIKGQRGIFIFACIAPRSGNPNYTNATWSGTLYSPTQHRRYSFSVSCTSNVRNGDPTGAWPSVPTSAGAVYLQSTLHTRTVINGVTMEAPAMTITSNGFTTGQGIANVDTEDGQVYYEMNVPLAVNP